MNPYRYKVSLRVRHPLMPHEEISKVLGLQPKTAWTIGTPRTMPEEHLPEGLHKETYWSARLVESNSETALEVTLTACLERLKAYPDFFNELARSKGRAEFFIGLFGDRNFGMELPPELLATCASLGVALSFDIYP